MRLPAMPPVHARSPTQLNRALEWLLAEVQFSHRRLAACLVLRQLAINTPTLFFAKRADFFERIWPVLRDSKQSIRDAASRRVAGAADALSLPNERRYWHTRLKKTIDRTRRVRS